ncbi:MAG: response regulator [bacterium]
MQILIVEDDFISRRLLCRYLESYGDCDVAVNGHEAVAAVHAALDSGSHYDLICLDIMMPGKCGQETLVDIRKLEARKGLQVGQGAKIIMTSALEDHEVIRKSFKDAADGYVVKPIVKRKFMDVLKEVGLKVELVSSGSDGT